MTPNPKETGFPSNISDKTWILRIFVLIRPVCGPSQIGIVFCRIKTIKMLPVKGNFKINLLGKWKARPRFSILSVWAYYLTELINRNKIKHNVFSSCLDSLYIVSGRGLILQLCLWWGSFCLAYWEFFSTRSSFRTGKELTNEFCGREVYF